MHSSRTRSAVQNGKIKRVKRKKNGTRYERRFERWRLKGRDEEREGRHDDAAVKKQQQPNKETINRKELPQSKVELPVPCSL